jgi:L1 cell adhesion molecule like protein
LPRQLSNISFLTEKTIGIDLGTTNSAAAFIEAGQPIIIPNDQGRRTTPSVVAFGRLGEILVGQLAKRQAAINPTNTFFSVKRLLGRNIYEVNALKSDLPYSVKGTENGNGSVVIQCVHLKQWLSPEEISAQVLRKIVKDCSIYLDEDVTKAVITVPAYFNDSQRQATKDAGRIAGLDVIRIINEPTAAALAYGLDKKKGMEFILVFDLGGGTFDCSILEVGEGVFEVLGTSGDTTLGGDDFDERILNWIVERFREKEGIDIMSDPRAVQRVVEAAERAKILLSSAESTKISLPFITVTAEGARHINEEITRVEFQAITSDLIERCRKPVKEALILAGVKLEALDQVLLVGGSTRIPAVKRLVKEMTGKKRLNSTKVLRGGNPDEVVALGAAVQAGVLTGESEDLVLLDVTPLTLGLETIGGYMFKLIEKNTLLPVVNSQTFTTATDNQTTVEINVVQGESEKVIENKSIGIFRLSGIVAAPRGTPKIAVAFDIDVNGILFVTAEDITSGIKADITITGSATLAKDEVERLTDISKVLSDRDLTTIQLGKIRERCRCIEFEAYEIFHCNGAFLSQRVQQEVLSTVYELLDAVTMKDLPCAQESLDRLIALGKSVYPDGEVPFDSA